VGRFACKTGLSESPTKGTSDGPPLLLSRNVNPKIVSEMLGHANIAITLDTYSHVLPDMQEKAAKALEEALR
jgi:integrase